MGVRYKQGDTAFLVESNQIVREVQIKSASGGMYLVVFKDTGGGIRVKEHRLFATKEEAEQHTVNGTPKKEKRITPWGYM